MAIDTRIKKSAKQSTKSGSIIEPKILATNIPI